MPSRNSQRTRFLASAMWSWSLAGVMILCMAVGPPCLFAQADTEKTEETESISPERIRRKLEELADSQLGEEQKSSANAAYDEALTQLELAEEHLALESQDRVVSGAGRRLVDDHQQDAEYDGRDSRAGQGNDDQDWQIGTHQAAPS